MSEARQDAAALNGRSASVPAPPDPAPEAVEEIGLLEQSEIVVCGFLDTQRDAVSGEEVDALSNEEADALPGEEVDALSGEQVDALPGEEVDALPVLAGEAPAVTPPSGPLGLPAPTVFGAAAVAAGGFVAGAAVVTVVRRRRARAARLAAARRRGPIGELVQIVGTRSVLVDVHLLGGRGR